MSEPTKCAECDKPLVGATANWPRCPTCRMPFCKQRHLEEHLARVASEVEEAIES